MIDPATLRAAVGCTEEAARRFAPHLDAACKYYQIDTPARLAAFLAQLGHESGSFRWVREIWGPTPAQSRYEGRRDLGNVNPGDGKRFMGRGLIQTTGRYNYQRVRDRLRDEFPDVPDFEAHPEELEAPRWAVFSAADYWADRDLNTLADAGDFLTITKRINGGTNGLEDRKRRWEKAKAVLMFAEQPPQPKGEPVAPFVAAALPALIELVPKLGRMFGSGSEVAERNIKAAEAVVEVAKEAINARNEQELIETVKADPQAAQTVREAISANWFRLEELGGGVEAARRADAAFINADGPWWQIIKSPSFVVACLLLPLVYLIVLSIIGAFGTAEWSADVRAAIAGTIVGSIVGGLVGYYYGQTTSRNRT